MRFALAIVVAFSACESNRAHPLLPDAGASAPAAVRAGDARRIAQAFVTALQVGDKAGLAQVLSFRELCDALPKASGGCVGPERMGAFRDALLVEATREEFRAPWLFATIARVEPPKRPGTATVVVSLDGGVEKRLDIAHDDGTLRVVRVFSP